MTSIQSAIGKVLLAVLALLVAGAGPAQATWNRNVGNPGTNGNVLAMASFAGAGGTFLFTGGDFTLAGGQVVNNIGRWDGTTWNALGAGLNGPVRAIIEFDDNTGTGPTLFVGGDFTLTGTTPLNRVARWDGTDWSPLGQGMDGAVHAFEIYDDGTGPALYAAGQFATADGITVNNIARWTGSGWAPVGSGTSGPIQALAVYDDRTGEGLYAGGLFLLAGAATVNNIARWDGANWSSLTSGTNGPVSALASFDDGNGTALFAGGAFSQAGGINAAFIARWDGFIWIPLGNGNGNGPVQTLEVVDELSGPAMYAGGDFTNLGGFTVNRIGKWNEAAWTSLQNGADNSVLALASFDDPFGPTLFVGGAFTDAGGAVQNIAKWDPGFITLPTKMRSATYQDADLSGTVNGGDLLILTFNNKISFAQGPVGPSIFSLPVTGDTLGSGAAMNISPFDPRQVHVHLGPGAQLNVHGPWLPPVNAPGSPSGIDISPTMTGAIRDEFNNDVEDNGVVNVNDGVRDIQYDVQSQQTPLLSGTGGSLRPGQYTYFNKHRFDVPPGVLQGDRTLTLRGGNLENPSAMTISPATAFLGTVTAVFEYKPLNVDRIGGDLEQGVRLRGWDPTAMTWRPLQGPQTIDRKRKTITAPILFDSTGGQKPGLFSSSSFSVFGNVGIPTVRAASGTIAIGPPKPGSLLASNYTISAGTDAIYTRHKIVLVGYVSGASLTVTLNQATLIERSTTGYTKNAIVKITTTAETAGTDLLTLEYKDGTEAPYSSDVPNANSEIEMQIFYWDSGNTTWVELPGTQIVDTINNLVTASVPNLANAQFYSVQPGMITTTGVGSLGNKYR